MTYSTLTIVNRALVQCGANRIDSLTDSNNSARTINAIYEQVRQEILVEAKWSFSVSRATLSTTVATTTIPWFHTNEAYVYTKPTGIIRIYELNDEDAEWREEGDYIISDTPDLGIKYIFDQTDASKWRPKFVKAFIDLLASEIAFQILNDSKKGNEFLEKYDKISLPVAMAIEAQAGTHNVVKDDAWLDAKYQNGTTEA